MLCKNFRARFYFIFSTKLSNRVIYQNVNFREKIQPIPYLIGILETEILLKADEVSLIFIINLHYYKLDDYNP